MRDGMLALKRQLEGGYFGGSDHLQIGPRQIWPYLAPERLDGLSTYWILDQEKTAVSPSRPS